MTHRSRYINFYGYPEQINKTTKSSRTYPINSKDNSNSEQKSSDKILKLNDIINDDKPIRIYVQISNDSQQAIYSKIFEKFKNSKKAIIPNFELVNNGIPKLSNIRYCKTTDEIANAAKNEIEEIIKPINLYKLPQELCNNVRSNHFEVWLSKDAK